MVTLKIHAWLGRVEIAVKQKIKKTIQLVDKKKRENDPYEPKLDTNPDNFALVSPN